ncbi:flagellar assembly peptidoglycan hydrolase FlgJ [Dyella kyungheensis]|jgi:flagellar protein FlgJ|uniref:Peptidoglycan hydrolase FlgJ n=1 Tax=Dyella kyungheensis TaxID=1242174 RepID=A0ABS2JTV1_9GAMM|nr:flagellar assembly peptidoglycan hydrolase FlgJ [Dyella kyungheensis]MBM7122432.1 flagellar assembly peptidoglycan hydrolase FlgJ [Dyella kyungheensis]
MAISGDAASSLNTWTDLSGFAALRQSAQSDAKAALPAVAKQFESIFTQMMLKSMRDASSGDGLFDSDAGNQWRDMFDQQLSVQLSQGGNGIGIAQMLVRQLGGKSDGTTGDANGSKTAGAAGLDDSWQKRLSDIAGSARQVGEKVLKLMPADAEDFVRQLAPYAQKAAEKLGVSVRAVLAQAALETQWGQHMPAHSNGNTSNNLFGMKAGQSWGGEKVSVPTLEFEGGVAVHRRAQFRSYDNPGQSFDDYAQLIAENPRYARALNHGEDVVGFARGLVNGGYATDPSYAQKIVAIANSPQMRDALDAIGQGALKKVGVAPNPSQ